MPRDIADYAGLGKGGGAAAARKTCIILRGCLRIILQTRGPFPLLLTLTDSSFYVSLLIIHSL